MRIKKILLLALFPISLFAQQNNMTLQQCIASAIANNITIKQSSLQADAAAVNATQAKNNLLPYINGNYSYGFNQGRNLNPLTNSYINQQLVSSSPGVNANVILFNGMRLQNIIRQNNFTYQAAAMDGQQAKDNLTLNVILAYLQVLNSEDVLEITDAQTAVSQKQMERMQILVNEGAAANYQLTDLKGQWATEQIAKVNAVNTLQQAILSLCQLMNIDYNSNLQLEKLDNPFPNEKYASTPAEIYKTSLQNFAAIKANEYKIKSAQTNIKISKAGFYPTLTVNGNLSSSTSSLAQTLAATNITQVPTGDYVIINGNQNPVLTSQQNYASSKTGYASQLNNNLGTYVGLSLQVPIFNGFSTKNKIKLAEINLKNTTLEADNAKLFLKQNIEQAYLNTTAAFNKYNILIEQVNNYEESFRAAEVRFTNGTINAPEYLIAKNNFNNAKINLAQAKYEYSFRVQVLDYYKGIKHN